MSYKIVTQWYFLLQFRFVLICLTILFSLNFNFLQFCFVLIFYNFVFLPPQAVHTIIKIVEL